MPQKTDEQIARDVQNGDVHAFAFLVQRFQGKLLRYARKFLFGYDDAHDAVQEVFIKAYVNIRGFDVQRSFSSWIYRIAHNEFINIIKKRGREPITFFDPDTILPHPLSRDNPGNDLQNNELKQVLDECLNQLDPKYREPLVLYYFEEMAYEAIAEIMRIPMSTVGVRLKRGREILQKVYNESLNGNGK